MQYSQVQVFFQYEGHNTFFVTYANTPKFNEACVNILLFQPTISVFLDSYVDRINTQSITYKHSTFIPKAQVFTRPNKILEILFQYLKTQIYNSPRSLRKVHNATRCQNHISVNSPSFVLNNTKLVKRASTSNLSLASRLTNANGLRSLCKHIFQQNSRIIL